MSESKAYIVRNTKEGRKATVEEIKDLIDDKELFIDYYLTSLYENAGKVFLDLRHEDYELVEGETP